MHLGALVLALVLVAPSFAAEAQQAGKTPRVGVLVSGSFPPSSAPPGPVRAGFLQELRALGYVEGQNIRIEYRRDEGNPARLPELAAELVRLRVYVIFAPSPAALDAGRSATKTIPIVMVTSRDDPIRAGLIESLARPGGNITGLTTVIGVGQKQLELLKEALPGLSRLGVVREAPFGVPEEFEDAAQSLGLRLARFEVRGPDDFNPVFDAALKERVGALHIAGTPFFGVHRKRLADLALKHRLPTVTLWRDRVEAGYLMSYGPNLPDLFRRAAHHVDKILKGVKPAVLPVEQPTKFDLVINMKTAKALGLTIPPSVLLRADQVIE